MSDQKKETKKRIEELEMARYSALIRGQHVERDRRDKIVDKINQRVNESFIAKKQVVPHLAIAADWIIKLQDALRGAGDGPVNINFDTSDPDYGLTE